MKKHISIFVFLFCSITCIHPTLSLEGCTYVMYGIQQYELKFLSSNICVVSQTDRVRCETRVDTFEYTCTNSHLIPLSPKCANNKTTNREKSPTFIKYRYDPYVYKDGKPIKCSPLGGAAAVHCAFPTTFIRKHSDGCFPIDSTFILDILGNPNYLLSRERRFNVAFKLKYGRPLYIALKPHRMKYDRMVKDAFRRYYMCNYYWFSRQKYTGEIPSGLSGQKYEYTSSILSESIHFTNDSVCVYSLLNNDTKASITYYCNYSLLPDGIIVVRADSSVPTTIDTKMLLPEQKEYPLSSSELWSVPTITCDTFLLNDDVLYYSKVYSPTTYSGQVYTQNEVEYYTKIYPKTDYYLNDSLQQSLGTSIFFPKTHLLQTKAFIRSGKKKSSIKIAKFNQKYYIPTNYLKPEK